MMPNKRLLGLAPEAMRYIILKVVCLWLSLAAGIVMWFAVGRQFPNLKDGGGTLPAVFLTAAACIALRFALTRLTSGVTHKASACVKAKVRGDIYGKIRRLGAGYADSFPTAEVVQLAGEGVEQLESEFGQYVPQFFYAFIIHAETVQMVFRVKIHQHTSDIENYVFYCVLICIHSIASVYCCAGSSVITS